jgi:hypothetical protein
VTSFFSKKESHQSRSGGSVDDKPTMIAVGHHRRQAGGQLRGRRSLQLVVEDDRIGGQPGRILDRLVTFARGCDDLVTGVCDQAGNESKDLIIVIDREHASAHHEALQGQGIEPL